MLQFNCTNINGYYPLRIIVADPSGGTVLGVGLRPLVYWDCWFESRRRNGCLLLVGVVCCRVYASG